MKKLLKTMALLALAWTLYPALPAAKDLLPTARYYRIYSADSLRYGGRCIQDSTMPANPTAWNYIVTACNPNNTRQRWRIFSAGGTDTTAYYIYNAATFKYLNSDVTEHKGSAGTFYIPQYTARRSAATVWHFTCLSNGQYIISSTDHYGVDRFLSACDSTRVPTQMRDSSKAASTAFAWYVADADSDITGISDATIEKAGIGVVNRRVVVTGTDRYTIYDIAGRPQPHDAMLPRGCYIVVADGQACKIIIR
jgi:hypothetical protein